VGGCVVISDKVQRTRKWALSWARYRQRDSLSLVCWINTYSAFITSGGETIHYYSLAIFSKQHPIYLVTWNPDGLDEIYISSMFQSLPSSGAWVPSGHCRFRTFSMIVSNTILSLLILLI